MKILDFGLAKLAEAPEAVRVERAFRPASQTSLLSPGGIQPGAGLNPAPNDSSDAHNGTPEGVPLQNGTLPDATLTRTGTAMGTAGYMSPEQARGEKLDARTDLFSFGLILYEMATGQRAFSGDTAAILKDAILNHTPAPVQRANPTLPPKLEEITNKALEKDREQRYQTAADIRTDLEILRARNQPLPGSAATGSSERRQRFCWRPSSGGFFTGARTGRHTSRRRTRSCSPTSPTPPATLFLTAH